MSNLGWLAFDESENQRIQNFLRLYTEPNARNELGLGQIRDSLSDLMFPGTSVLHTRVRYMLFIPWLFKRLESGNNRDISLFGESEIRNKAKKLELKFISSLKNGEVESGKKEFGIHGGVVGNELKYLPSVIYWSCLKSWGICSVVGNSRNLYNEIYKLRKGKYRNSIEIDDPFFSKGTIWCDSLPEAPKGLLKSARFDLTKDDSEFFIGQLEHRHPKSLITYLAKSNETFECDYVWELQDWENFPKDHKKLIYHGKMFSIVMQGASILYNLELSRCLPNSDRTSDYEFQLDEWHKELNELDYKHWSVDEFWNEVSHTVHKIREPAKKFVESWLDLVSQDTKFLKDPEGASVRLIKDREMKLKRKNSRFQSKSALDSWTGDSGINRFDYRWKITRRHLNDITKATQQ